MLHILRIEENHFKNLLSGIKKSEIRYNDRDYQKGDLLAFKLLARPLRENRFEITHIHSGPGMKEGYVALSLELLY